MRISHAKVTGKAGGPDQTRIYGSDWDEDHVLEGVQAQSTTLDALASVSPASGKLPYFTGSSTADVADLSSFGRSLIDDVNASAALTTLGVAANVKTWLATPSSANLAASLTDETGTGAAVFAGSPALTGTPTAPTATGGTNTTQIATTAFVQSAVSTAGVSSLNTLTGALTWSVVLRVITASGTYTPTSGMQYAIIECIGGGGAGGGSASSAGQNSGGGGGGAGSYSRKRVTASDIGASKAVTIGAGGAAGTGDFTPTGERGSNGLGTASSATIPAWGGNGASSLFGGSGAGANAGTSTNGSNATSYGGGGGGAESEAAGGSRQGGAGGDGCVIITEYVLS